MAKRKIQLYLTEEQYQVLKQRSGDSGSIAAAVRDLVDASGVPADPKSDPFFQYLTRKRKPSGTPYDAGDAKRELYERPR